MPWLMNRVDGDIMDLAPLKSAFDLARNNKLLVGAVLVLDFLAAQKRDREQQ